MPRFSDHLVKSAIRLVRQSTTVPNTSKTSALTAEISDIFAPPVLNGLSGTVHRHDPDSRVSRSDAEPVIGPANRPDPLASLRNDDHFQSRWNFESCRCSPLM